MYNQIYPDDHEPRPSGLYIAISDEQATMDKELRDLTCFQVRFPLSICYRVVAMDGTGANHMLGCGLVPHGRV